MVKDLVIEGKEVRRVNLHAKGTLSSREIKLNYPALHAWLQKHCHYRKLRPFETSTEKFRALKHNLGV